MIRRAAAAFVLACSTQHAAADILWGANGHPITAYPGIPIADQIDLLADLGMGSYRVNVSFAEQAAYLGNAIEAGKLRGIEILPVLTPGGLDEADTIEVLYEKSFAFANALGRQFGDDVRVWELGNELETYAILQPCEMRDDGTQYPCEWGPAGGVDPLDYHGERWRRISAILRGLSDGIEAAAPDAIKAMGTAGWGHVGAFERMRRDGVDWDVSVWHIYGEDPEWAFEILKGFHRPIWVTEINHPYGSQNGAEAQAEGLAAMLRRLRDLSEEYRVEAVHVYELLDEPYWDPSFEAVMGLASLVPTPESWMVGPPKPAYWAVRDLIQRTRAERCADPGRTASPTPHVQAAYAHCLLFGGIRDAQQVETWATGLAAGESSAGEMVAVLASSPEFAARHRVSDLDNLGFVELMYRSLLGRDPDGHGLHSYADQLGAGAMSRLDLVRVLVSSGEFQARHPLLRMGQREERTVPLHPCAPMAADAGSEGERVVAFASCLLQAPDPAAAGLTQWTGPIDAGDVARSELLAAALRSAVFGARHRIAELSDAEYIRYIFNLLLGRDADGAGLEAYRVQLQAGLLTRQDLAVALMQSEEFAARHGLHSEPTEEAAAAPQPSCDPVAAAGTSPAPERRVAYLHCLILGAVADEAFLREWSQALAEGRAGSDGLVLALVRSEAFAERYRPDALSDAEFVTLIFRLLLGREPDGAGLAAYVAQLEEGAISRDNVALGTFWSNEFGTRHAALAD